MNLLWQYWTFPFPGHHDHHIKADLAHHIFCWSNRISPIVHPRSFRTEPDAPEWLNRTTEPKQVIDFIVRDEDLSALCEAFPQYLAAYAPQVTMPGCGGPFEGFFESALQESIKRYEMLTSEFRHAKFIHTESKVGFPMCAKWIALRHPSYGGYSPQYIAELYFVRLRPTRIYVGAGSEEPRRLEDAWKEKLKNESEIISASLSLFDYMVWLLSKKSQWLPESLRKYLLLGTKKIDWSWASSRTWWHLFMENGSYSVKYADQTNDLFTDANPPFCGKLYKSMCLLKKDKSGRAILTYEAMVDLRNRMLYAKRVMNLEEPVDVLVERFIEERFVEQWEISRAHELV